MREMRGSVPVSWPHGWVPGRIAGVRLSVGLVRSWLTGTSFAAEDAMRRVAERVVADHSPAALRRKRRKAEYDRFMVNLLEGNARALAQFQQAAQRMHDQMVDVLRPR